jgi:hypothetical protein
MLQKKLIIITKAGNDLYFYHDFAPQIGKNSFPNKRFCTAISGKYLIHKFGSFLQLDGRVNFKA